MVCSDLPGSRGWRISALHDHRQRSSRIVSLQWTRCPSRISLACFNQFRPVCARLAWLWFVFRVVRFSRNRCSVHRRYFLCVHLLPESSRCPNCFWTRDGTRKRLLDARCCLVRGRPRRNDLDYNGSWRNNWRVVVAAPLPGARTNYELTAMTRLPSRGLRAPAPCV